MAPVEEKIKREREREKRKDMLRIMSLHPVFIPLHGSGSMDHRKDVSCGVHSKVRSRKWSGELAVVFKSGFFFSLIPFSFLRKAEREGLNSQ